MTGGVAALISLMSGGTFVQTFWNYVLFGYLGITALGCICVIRALVSRALVERRTKA